MLVAGTPGSGGGQGGSSASGHAEVAVAKPVEQPGSPARKPVRVPKTAAKLTPGDRRAIVRLLAAGEVKRIDIARQFGVSATYITTFAKERAREIEAVRADLDNEFAGLWIADKAARIAATEEDHQRSLDGRNADHFEQIRTRAQLRHQIAEELGQLPGRGAMITIPVEHVLINVNLDELK